MSKSRLFYVYVLVSYGRRSTSLAMMPGARAQLGNFFAFAKAFDAELKILCDYARIVRTLDDLPILKAALTEGQGSDFYVVLDDFRRLCSRCPLEHRQEFRNSLSEHDHNIKDLRTTKRFSELDQPLTLSAINHAGPVHYTHPLVQRPKRHPIDTKLQTHSARRASTKARSSAADNKARELSEVKSKLVAEHGNATNEQIAQEANSRGLQTTRGGKWSRGTVQRALARLAQPNNESRT